MCVSVRVRVCVCVCVGGGGGGGAHALEMQKCGSIYHGTYNFGFPELLTGT